MFRTNISSIFPHHTFIDFNSDIYITDYTQLTFGQAIKRSVEIFSPDPPLDNDYFKIENNDSIEISNIIFDNKSFVHINGNPKSQCETTSFPKVSTIESWILFTELKYSSKPLNNENNLKKAIKQLFKTRYHYIQSNIYKENENTSYLIASLPLQSEPFANFSLTPAYLSNLKEKHNIILRLTNSLEVIDDKILLV